VPDLSLLKIQWFGGEPLAAKDIVLDISNAASNLAKQNPEIRYRSSMTTNGYFLNVELMSQLIEVGVQRFQILLDGPCEFHDRTRRRANGEGTFQQIWSNLIALKQTDLDFTIVLRVHLTPENIDSMPEFVTKLLDSFDDSRFSIIFREILHMGGPNDKIVNVLKGSGYSMIAKLKKLVEERQPSLTVNEPSSDEICYAAKANSFIIRANGNVGKCTVAIEEDRNNVGKLLEDGRVVISVDKLKPWMRGLTTLDSSVLSCPAANWPKLTRGSELTNVV
jgi:uncharacterized protein